MPSQNQHAKSSAGSSTRATVLLRRFLGFAEGEAIKLAGADFAGGDVFHFRRDKIDGATNLFGAGFEATADDRSALVIFANGALGLVDDDDFGARPGDPDHLLDGSSLVGKEVDTADMKYAVERVDFEWETFGFRLEEVGFASQFEKIALALVEHSPGEIGAVEVDVLREEAEVGAGSNGNLEDAGARLELEFVDELMAVIWLACEPMVNAFGQVVAGSDAVVESLVFDVGAGDGADEERDAFADGIDATGGGIAQIIAGHFEGVAGIRVT